MLGSPRTEKGSGLSVCCDILDGLCIIIVFFSESNIKFQKSVIFLASSSLGNWGIPEVKTKKVAYYSFSV